MMNKDKKMNREFVTKEYSKFKKTKGNRPIDPTHVASSCSILSVSGFNATCGCNDANVFNLANGLPITENLPCGLKNYRVEQSGNNLLITN